MLTRTGLGGQYQSLSADGGATWSEPVLSQLVGTAAPVSLSRIPTTGDLLAIWNHNPARPTRRTATAIRSRPRFPATRARRGSNSATSKTLRTMPGRIPR